MYKYWTAFKKVREKAGVPVTLELLSKPKLKGQSPDHGNLRYYGNMNEQSSNAVFRSFEPMSTLRAPQTFDNYLVSFNCSSHSHHCMFDMGELTSNIFEFANRKDKSKLLNISAFSQSYGIRKKHSCITGLLKIM